MASLSSFFLVTFLNKSEEDDDQAMDELERALQRISNSESFDDDDEAEGKLIEGTGSRSRHEDVPSGIADASVSLEEISKSEKPPDTSAKEEKDLDTILEWELKTLWKVNR